MAKWTHSQGPLATWFVARLRPDEHYIESFCPGSRGIYLFNNKEFNVI